MVGTTRLRGKYEGHREQAAGLSVRPLIQFVVLAGSGEWNPRSHKGKGLNKCSRDTLKTLKRDMYLFSVTYYHGIIERCGGDVQIACNANLRRTCEAYIDP